MFKRFRGLTIIEAMLIISVIVVLIMVFFPKYLEKIKIENEQQAVIALEKISSACEEFKTLSTTGIYPETLEELGNEKSKLIDKTLASGIVSGYRFNYTRTSDNGFECLAIPLKEGITADQIFFVDQSKNVRIENIAGEVVMQELPE